MIAGKTAAGAGLSSSRMAYELADPLAGNVSQMAG